jgi:hypothetical protein
LIIRGSFKTTKLKKQKSLIFNVPKGGKNKILKRRIALKQGCKTW